VIDGLLRQYGVYGWWKQRQSSGEYLDNVPIRLLKVSTRAEEILIEPGYGSDDYQLILALVAIDHKDRLVFDGTEWDVLPVTKNSGFGEVAYTAVCRRVISQNV